MWLYTFSHLIVSKDYLFLLMCFPLLLHQRERYLLCSKGQLSFVPTSGNNIRNGIMIVTLNSNIKGMSYLDVSNQVMDKLQLDDVESDHTMFVMPDSVDFGTGAAYGENMGSISWFMSSVASYPVVQVRS